MALDIDRNLTQLLWKKLEMNFPKVKTISTQSSREKWILLRTTSTWWIKDFLKPKRLLTLMVNVTKTLSLKCKLLIRRMFIVQIENLRNLSTKMMSIWMPILIYPLVLWKLSPKTKWPALLLWTTPNTLNIGSQPVVTNDYGLICNRIRSLKIIINLKF
jgi:hypothetical protein